MEATTTLIHEEGNMDSTLTSERPGVPWATSISISSAHDVTVAVAARWWEEGCVIKGNCGQALLVQNLNLVQLKQA